ncbi:PBP1A family penicillin-binding protein [Aquibacillus halophilus]|uniref:PBP1A family penicillin-binding protein n=1 Tax=Aquibacillus halophilus TaxID=930132 RepID=A0A6A8DMA2_9BACI|nr:PBP1A family penicillin-binding protein [Aquibacillus halophilus]MRH44147.1 PBP1A family penicillin-binding protein [Aquibacillus halophilus]
MNKFKQLLSWILKIKWPIIVLGLTILLGIIGYLFILFGGRFVVDDKDFILPSTTTIVTKEGNTVAKLYDENRSPVKIDNIPDHVENAFLAIEDQRFYDHAGVDFTSVMRAIYRDIIAGGKVEGGSTITQQLAKNLFLNNDKTWMRKTKEVMASIYLERNFSKTQIIELYLNEIYFAHGLYGIGSATEFYFNKKVDDLTITEGAMLAALSKAPNTYSPVNNPEKAIERRNLVLQQMNKLNMIETEEMIQLQGKTLGLNQSVVKEKPWMDDYIDLVIKEAADELQLTLPELKRGGYQIVINLNEQAQEIAYQHLQNDSYFYGSTEGVQAAFVLVNKEQGEIEAILAGRDFSAGDINRALVPRQPGSVIKPLAVYGPAMMLDDYKPYTLLPDEKRTYNGNYTPTNFDDQYSGSVTMYDAIKQSKNAPAVWLLDQIGIDYSKSYLEKMSITLPDDGLSIALGGLEHGLTPVQLAEGYRSFIQDGEWTSANVIDKVYDRYGVELNKSSKQTKEVFSPQVAWNMVRMLESVITEGTGTSGDYDKALAGKTGTTQHPNATGHIKDAWFVGITPDYVTSLWMGYDQSDESQYLTKGSEAPTILTKSILKELSKQQPLSATFDQPENVEDLPEPVRLPKISDLQAEYELGGFSLVRGKLTWTATDRRIVYQIYKENDDGNDELIGEVDGQGDYTINRVNVFNSSTYYVVPYDPITKQQGARSNRAVLSF